MFYKFLAFWIGFSIFFAALTEGPYLLEALTKNRDLSEFSSQGESGLIAACVGSLLFGAIVAAMILVAEKILKK